MVDIYYPTRPENVCLYDFVKWYAYSGTRDNGTRVYQKLQKPMLPYHKLFEPSIENQREEYHDSVMLLFIPFRDESNLLQRVKQLNLLLIASLLKMHQSKHHDKLQSLL